MMDEPLMKACDAWLTARIAKRDMPHDFDDITWVMHDFVREYINQRCPHGNLANGPSRCTHPECIA